MIEITPAQFRTYGNVPILSPDGNSVSIGTRDGPPNMTSILLPQYSPSEILQWAILAESLESFPIYWTVQGGHGDVNELTFWWNTPVGKSWILSSPAVAGEFKGYVFALSYGPNREVRIYRTLLGTPAEIQAVVSPPTKFSWGWILAGVGALIVLTKWKKSL